MGVAREPKSALGPSILLVVLLIDVGLVVWGWHLYQRRQERLDDAGLNFARAPDAAPPAPAPPAQDDAPSGIDRYVVKESLNARPLPGRPVVASGAVPTAPSAHPPAPALPPAAQAAPESRVKMDHAVDAFFALKNSARFKQSPVIQAWTREFLSHPDLKALNDQWRREHDPLKFLVGMVKSPNFREMTKKYLAQADMAAFIKGMATSPAVLSSAGTFMANDSVKGAVSALNLAPGLGAAPMQDSAAAIGRMKDSPSLKGVLDASEVAPAVR